MNLFNQLGYFRAFIMIFITFIHGATLAKDMPGNIFSSTQSFSGYLGYVDYRLNKKVTIPIMLRFSHSADIKHLIVDKVYIDLEYQVYSLSLMNIDKENQAITEAKNVSTF